LFVQVIEDRAELLGALPPAAARISTSSAAEWIASRQWQPDEAIVLVSRNYELDRAALASAMRATGAGYVGMIGSRRKVEQVFDELRRDGVTVEALRTVYAPIGLDIGADSPAEIAVSVVAEILGALRKKSGKNLRAFRDKAPR
jgi:xanthine dehydrogenase accessory factor